MRESHRKLSPHLQEMQGTLFVVNSGAHPHDLTGTLRTLLWAVDGNEDWVVKAELVTGGYGKFEIFKHRKFAYRRMREMKAGQDPSVATVERIWTNVKADTFVECGSAQDHRWRQWR